MFILDITCSRSTSRKDSVSSRSSEEKVVCERDAQFPIVDLFRSSRYQQSISSTLKDWMSSALLGGDTGGLHPPKIIPPRSVDGEVS